MTATMRFRNLSWRFNPHTVKITSKKDIVENHIPLGDNVVQSFGRSSRVITGEGCLYGADCFSQYRDLWKLYRENKIGVLSLPEFLVVNAHFTSLQIIGEPTDNLIKYIFTFTEIIERDREKSPVTEHTADGKENLWDIGYKYNISVEELLSLNTTIKHPFAIEKGFKVKLC